MSEASDHNLHEYVTAVIGGQLFGLPILRVQDVFAPERLTRVPLAPREIAALFPEMAGYRTFRLPLAQKAPM